MVNIISAIEGDKGKFARAEYATYKTVFPQVFLFTVNDAKPDEVQNLMLVALKSEKIPGWKSSDQTTNQLLSQVWNKPIANDLPILTDDFAPVEYYKRLSI